MTKLPIKSATVLLLAALGGCTYHSKICDEPNFKWLCLNPPAATYTNPPPVITSPLGPGLAVTRIACGYDAINATERLRVTATIANHGPGNAAPFWTKFDVSYTERPKPSNPHPVVEPKTGLVLTGGVLPAGATTDVDLHFNSRGDDPNGPQPNIDPNDTPFDITVSANSGNGEGSIILIEASHDPSEVRKCNCDFAADTVVCQ